MGYECKVYVVDAVDERWADTVAVFDLCKIGEKNLTSYRNLFTKEVGYKIFIDDNTAVNEDRYGAPLKSASVEDVVAWLTEVVKVYKYRRFRPLLGLLKGFKKKDWPDLEVVHYGY